MKYMSRRKRGFNVKPKHIKINASDLHKLKKYKHMSSDSLIIDVVEGYTSNLKVFGKK